MSLKLKYGDLVLIKNGKRYRLPDNTKAHILLVNEDRERCYVETLEGYRHGKSLNGLAYDDSGFVISLDDIEKISDNNNFVNRHLKQYIDGDTISDGMAINLKFVSEKVKRGDLIYSVSENVIGFITNNPYSDSSEYYAEISCLYKNRQRRLGGSYAAVKDCIKIDTNDEKTKEFVQTAFNSSLEWFIYYYNESGRRSYENNSLRNVLRLANNAGIEVNSPVCSHCNENITTSEIHVDNDNFLCDNCFRELYASCVRCGNNYNRQDVPEWDNLCPRCYKRNYVLPYHRHEPKIEFYGDDKNNSVPYMGVEIEVDGGGELDENVEKVMDSMNPKDKFFVYCSHDSSIERGFEIITQPATLAYHESIKGIYDRTFKMLRQYSYSSHDTTTCGLHVHFNRNFYSDNEELYIARLLYLVDKFWDEIIKFSRRNYRSIDQYSKKVDMAHEDFIYRSNKRKGDADHGYHYYAINLLNPNTIEFRMFRGTMNTDTFIATLQFVQNCIMTAKRLTTEQIQAMEFEELIDTRLLRKYWNRRLGIDGNEE